MKFTDRKVLVIGDLILDEYLHGDATRISQEAPVPIVRFRKFEYRLGGAGNVAANIASLGGKVHVIGMIGDDKGGSKLENLFLFSGISWTESRSWSLRRTTIKTRIIANGQQISRVDIEDTDVIGQPTLTNLVSTITRESTDACAIVVSDYAKGVIAPEVMDCVRSCGAARNIPIFLDPKVRNAAAYRVRRSYPLEFITPNHHEAEGLNGKSAGVYEIGTNISARYAAKNVLITRGEHGMTLISHVPNAAMLCVDIPTAAKEVFDVSGAGDTVIATLALAVASSYSVEQAAKLANLAAGVVVGKRGTATVSYAELAAAGGSEICVDDTIPPGL